MSRNAFCRPWDYSGIAAVLLVAAGGIANCLATDQPRQSVAGSAVSSALEDRISRLIRMLGAEQFATRERAQAELERLGSAAFDALHDAQDDPDIEVAHRVRHLLLGMRVIWSRESDSAEVRRILKDYGDKDEGERRSRMDRLASLEIEEAIEPLCRLARFDTADGLSKHAALLVMNGVRPEDESTQRQLAERIRGLVDGSRRSASTWLRTYAQSLTDPAATIDQWQKLTQAELATMDRSVDPSSRETTRDLLRWYAEFLHRHDRQEESLAVIRKTLTLTDGTRDQLVDTIDWLMEHEAFSLVGELASRYTDQFNESMLLKYRWAESLLRQGQVESAEQTAREASELRADEASEHILAALVLQERGLFDWAEREYRLVLDLAAVGTTHDLRARFLLSEMLHDLQRDGDAHQVLEVAVTAMDQDRNIQQLVERFGRDVKSTRSRMHYFAAQHHASTGEWNLVKERLEKAIASDPNDADALIAMYRLPDATEAWKTKTVELIEAAANVFRTKVRELQRQYNLAPNEYVARQLALDCNQLAWLVGNTEGDYDEALKLSHLSLELMPDRAGYLDTLGRCYYAKRDYENAVKYQSRAVRLEPHTMQIRRQLELFEQALAQQQAQAAPDAE